MSLPSTPFNHNGTTYLSTLSLPRPGPTRAREHVLCGATQTVSSSPAFPRACRCSHQELAATFRYLSSGGRLLSQALVQSRGKGRQTSLNMITGAGRDGIYLPCLSAHASRICRGLQKSMLPRALAAVAPPWKLNYRSLRFGRIRLSANLALLGFQWTCLSSGCPAFSSQLKRRSPLLDSVGVI